jgi:hypothetical protein
MKIRVDDLILRLMIDKDNKLSKRRANSSSMASKANTVE